MTSMKKALVALGVAVGVSVLTVSWSLAADSGSVPADKAAKILVKHPDADADKDGTLTRKELADYLKSRSGKGKPEGTGPLKGPMMGRGDRANVLKNHPELDTNKDGVLSDEEWEAGRSKLWAGGREEVVKKILQDHPEADLNGDGTLSFDEFTGFRGKNPDYMMGLGPMGRPPVSPSAMIDRLIERFDEIDLDHNGQLSRDELTKFKEKLGPGAGLGPFGFGGPGKVPGGPPREKILQRFPDADTDKDGKLSDAELKAFMEQHPGGLRGEGKGLKGAGDGSGKGRQNKGARRGQTGADAPASSQ